MITTIQSYNAADSKHFSPALPDADLLEKQLKAAGFDPCPLASVEGRNIGFRLSFLEEDLAPLIANIVKGIYGKEHGLEFKVDTGALANQAMNDYLAKWGLG